MMMVCERLDHDIASVRRWRCLGQSAHPTPAAMSVVLAAKLMGQMLYGASHDDGV